MMKDLLLCAGPGVFVEGSGVDVDRVLLAAYQLEADYLSLPDGVLGRTLFRADGSAQIEISRELADEAEIDTLARRRFRTTLAHECGHIACHRMLFQADTETMSLFPSGEGTKRRSLPFCAGKARLARGTRGNGGSTKPTSAWPACSCPATSCASFPGWR